MPSILFFSVLLLFVLNSAPSLAYNYNLSFSSSSTKSSSSAHLLPGIELPAETNCDGNLKTEQDQQPKKEPLKLNLNHRSVRDPPSTKKQSLTDSTNRDVFRIQTLFTRITEKKKTQNQNAGAGYNPGRKAAGGLQAAPAAAPLLAGRLMATLESGVTLGSGEYIMDVFIGTPPRHFSLILDTGSDLNWIQCAPCIDCFEQSGPVYNPAQSSSYKNVSCKDPRCALVAAPEPGRTCQSSDQPCPYFYWYGDRSNTTGDLALETFTVNLTAHGDSHRVEELIFGCGHWNRGLFHGAAGLLGLGRGSLSFASQLRDLYGHGFSYCLVDRNSDLNVSSKLIFGQSPELVSHPQLNYTSFISGGDNNPADTFYYVKIKSIIVGGERLEIPVETWEISNDGSGGTIIDSGTTLSYFSDQAYKIIRDAFVKKVGNYYPLVDDFPVLSPCYNVSGFETVDLPTFAVEFADGAVWNFPKENYFIRLDPEEIMCLAILGTPQSSLSIIGNYQQQNFHVLYDLKEDRLGFAPMRCAEV
ncbi:hypothetical protein LUZ60_012625 [Juncus effusus]|nr:hypothetical protein LUZ60_012625 [Juncus effusus]